MPRAARERRARQSDDKEHEELARRVGVADEHLDGLEFGGGLLGVELAQRVEDGGGESCGRQLGADDELRSGGTCLRDGIVDLPAGFALDVFFVDIVDDADMREPSAAVVEDMADGVAIGPMGESAR